MNWKVTLLITVPFIFTILIFPLLAWAPIFSHNGCYVRSDLFKSDMVAYAIYTDGVLCEFGHFMGEYGSGVWGFDQNGNDQWIIDEPLDVDFNSTTRHVLSFEEGGMRFVSFHEHHSLNGKINKSVREYVPVFNPVVLWYIKWFKRFKVK